MSKSRTRQRQPQKAAPPKRKNNKLLWIVGAAVVVAVLGLWVANSAGQKSASAAPPEEQKYIGRLLPANYREPSVSGIQAYASTIKMTNLTAEVSGAQVSIPVDKLVADKIVYFEAKNAAGEQIPLVAYVKPSGKLFVGVSYCPPCRGKGQRIEAGGILTCETCGTKRNLETGIGLSGACRLYPLDELPATVANGKVSIQKSSIDSWSPQPLDRPTGA